MQRSGAAGGYGANRRNVRTVAMMNGGAVVEREIDPKIVFEMNRAAGETAGTEAEKDKMIFIVLKEWDYSVAERHHQGGGGQVPGVETLDDDGRKDTGYA